MLLGIGFVTVITASITSRLRARSAAVGVALPESGTANAEQFRRSSSASSRSSRPYATSRSHPKHRGCRPTQRVFEKRCTAPTSSVVFSARRRPGRPRRSRRQRSACTCVLEDLQPNRLECRPDRPDLGEDVDAVAIVLDHLLDAAHLAFDSVKTLDERVLVLCISVAHRPSRRLWKRRSRSELVTTNTLENAIAAAATIGFRRPRTASGIATTL